MSTALITPVGDSMAAIIRVLPWHPISSSTSVIISSTSLTSCAVSDFGNLITSTPALTTALISSRPKGVSRELILTTTSVLP